MSEYWTKRWKAKYNSIRIRRMIVAIMMIAISVFTSVYTGDGIAIVGVFIGLEILLGESEEEEYIRWKALDFRLRR